MWECGGGLGSEKLFKRGCSRVQYPNWLCGRVHISVNVLGKVAAKLAKLCNKHHAVRNVYNVTVWCEFQAIRAQQDEQLRVKDIQV